MKNEVSLLTTLDGERWSYDWCVEPSKKAYTYYYSVEREGVVLKTEWLSGEASSGYDCPKGCRLYPL